MLKRLTCGCMVGPFQIFQQHKSSFALIFYWQYLHWYYNKNFNIYIFIVLPFFLGFVICEYNFWFQ